MAKQNSINFAANSSTNFAINLVSAGPNALDVNGSIGIGAYAGINAASSQDVIMSGSLGIGTPTPTATLTLTRNSAATSGSSSYFKVSQVADIGQTASTESPTVLFDFSSANRTWNTGNLSIQRYFRISQPNISFSGSSVVTNLATLGIDGAPIQGINATITNTHGILIGSGSVSSATNSYGITVNSQIGATNNYAAQFLGGNVGIQQSNPTAYLHIAAGTSAANTSPLKLTAGTNLTSPESGAIEFDGTTTFITNSTPARRAIALMNSSFLTNHGVVLGAGTSTLSVTAVGTTNTVLLGNTGADPSFGQVPNAALVNSSITVNAGSNISVTGSPVSLGGSITIATINNGNVTGPVSSTDKAAARFDGTTGKLIQNSGVIIDDSNNVTGVNTLNISGSSGNVLIANTSSLVVDATNSRIGVGTASPDYAIHANDTVSDSILMQVTNSLAVASVKVWSSFDGDTTSAGDAVLQLGNKINSVPNSPDNCWYIGLDASTGSFSPNLKIGFSSGWAIPGSNDLISILTNGTIGVGNASPSSVFQMDVSGSYSGTFSAGNSKIIGIGSSPVFSYSSILSSDFSGLQITPSYNPPTSRTWGGLYGIFCNPYLTGAGTGTASSLTGAYITCTINQTGTVSQIASLTLNYPSITNATVTTVIGMQIADLAASGATITNSYSIYAATPTSGTNKYTAILGDDSTAKVGIGTSVPRNMLDVAAGVVIGSAVAGASTAPTNGMIVQGSLVMNTAALSTSATDGFIYESTCPGTPTGTPTTNTGRSAIVIDSTNNIPYFYNGRWVCANGKVLISSRIVSGGAVASVTFSSIPQVFNNLTLVIMARSDLVNSVATMAIRFNTDTGANYNRTFFRVNGSTQQNGIGNAVNMGIIADIAGSTTTANYSGICTVSIPNYKTTTFFKTCVSTYTNVWNSLTLPYTGIWSSSWANTNAISTITLLELSGGNFINGSAFYLYGEI